jgi:hypothetical protein
MPATTTAAATVTMTATATLSPPLTLSPVGDAVSSAVIVTVVVGARTGERAEVRVFTSDKGAKGCRHAPSASIESGFLIPVLSS